MVVIAADYDKRSKLIRDQVMIAANGAVKDGYQPRKLFELLLNTAQLEYILQQVSLPVESSFIYLIL